jgi:hypothetical protein
MYSFEPTEEQKMLIDAINRFAVSDLRKISHEADEDCSLPVEVIALGGNKVNNAQAIAEPPELLPPNVAAGLQAFVL